MIGEVYKNTPVSAYNPSKEIKDFTAFVQKDFQTGDDILNRPWMELNDMSVIERDNRDQRTFNAFVDESIEDPAESWKWIGTRSKARNKAIAMHAQLTAGYIIPMFMAQNENDEEDRDFSDLMRDGAEWLVENSNYKSSFLQVVMGMLVNTVTYMGAEYCEVYQTIREKTEKGYTKKEILDEVLSGFQAPVYSASQVLITNAFEQNIQRQRCVMKRRWIEYSEAQAKYKDHENFIYVQPGVNTIFNAQDNLFYDIKDEDHPYMVMEVTPMYRTDDTEVCYLGGIYMGNDNLEANPIKHRDNRNAPKYDIVPFGYQRINEHFFFYKSLMNAQYWDNMLLDAQYQIGMNRSILDTEMPIAISGNDKVDTDVIFPNAVVAFQDKDVRVTPLLPQANLSNMFASMSAVEKSMDESSVSDVSAGQLPGGDQKATGIAIAERNAKTLLLGVGKTLAESMVQYGSLMADIFVNHFTVPQVDQIMGENMKLKYRSFVLKNKVVNGKEVSKTIRFDDTLLGKEMSEEERTNEDIKLAMEVGYPNNKESIYRVNPEVFARMKYLTRIEPERMFPRNEEFMQGMLTQLYTTLANNPFVSLESITRKLLHSFFRGESDELMQKPQENTISQIQNPKQTVAGQMAQNKAVGNGMALPGLA